MSKTKTPKMKTSKTKTTKVMKTHPAAMKPLSLLPGVVAPRPRKGRSQIHGGIQPLSPFAVAQRFQPLPPPLGTPPYHFDLETALPGIGKNSSDAGKIVFHTVGDTGGVK